MGRGGTDQLMAYPRGVCGGKAFADLPCTSFILGEGREREREAVEEIGLGSGARLIQNAEAMGVSV